MRNKIKLFLLFLGLIILAVLISRVNFQEIIKTIGKANLYFAFFGVVFYVALIFTRSLKWFLLSKKIKKDVKYKEILPLYLANSLFGNITPLKSGEVASAFLFKRFLKIPTWQGFSIIFLDRFFELVVFSFILLLSVFYILNSRIKNMLAISIFQNIFFVLAFLIIFLLIFIFSRKIALKIIRILAYFAKNNRPFKKLFDYIEKSANLFYDAFDFFKGIKTYFLMGFLTFLVWFFEIISFYFVFISVFRLPFFEITSAQIIAAGATFLTLIPTGFGVAELSIIYILGLLKYSNVQIISALLLCRILLTGMLFLSGLIGFLTLRKKIS